MVAKISVGNSLYGAIAYNGEKINEAQGRLLTTNRIYNDGSGTVDIGKAMEGFHTFLPPQMKVEKPVDRKSTRLNSSHPLSSRMPSSA